MQPLNTLPPISLFAIGIIAALILLGLIFYLLRGRARHHPGDPFEDLYHRIHEDIKFAVSPKFMELSMGVNELVDLAVEVWRIEQRLGKVSSDLPENHRKGLEISVEKLKRYIAKYDIEVRDYTGQKFNDGLNLDILSVEKDHSLAAPVVKQTIEPTIMCKGQVVRKAKIILLTNQ